VISMALPENKVYTIDDIYDLPEGTRAELIDGQIYYMAPPSSVHQEVSMELSTTINQYIKSKGGPCKVYAAPFAVYIKKHDDRFYVEPDISVVCDPDKINRKGCKGAPDWIIEIASPSNSGYDYITKLNLYQDAGVREYWIVNPKSQNILVYYFDETELSPQQYTFKDNVKVNIYNDFEIDFNQITYLG